MTGTKFKSLLLAAVVAFATLVGGAAMVGSAAAQDAGNTLADETLDVDNDTQSVQALAENSTAVLDVTVYGVDSDGNETEVDTGTLDATSNTTATYEYTSLDPTMYDQYRVVVEGDGADTVEVSKVQVISGGGGLLPDWGGGMAVPGALVAIVGLVGLVGAAIYTGRY